MADPSVPPANRRPAVATISDAILGYWLGGTDHEELAEWWQTDEAVDTATEMAHAILQALEERGLNGG